MQAYEEDAVRWYVVLFFFVLALLLSSCSRAEPVSMTSGVDIGGTLVDEIWAGSDCVQPGDNVQFRATVTNKSATTQVIESKDKPVLDIWIGSDVAVIAHWSDGKPLTPDLTRLELKPGESKTIEMNWLVQKSPVGFSVSARFNYSDRFPPLTPSVLINVGICPGPFGP